jgi:peptidoglycan hydrolase-like protein with peptidoglycan-binding domain
MVKIGCCTTNLLPNDVTLNDHDYSRATITQAMLNEAAQYTIPAYSFVNPDQYSIRHAIYHKGTVGLMFQIGAEWYTPDWFPQNINPLKPPHPVIGQHEVTGEHWTDQLEGIENSWSNQWNEAGYAEYNLSNYAPLQVICIDDYMVDFNPNQPVQFKFNKDMSYGQTNPDILQLQKRLGVIQTGYFGTLTRAAVVKYQQSHNIVPAVGYCGILTRTSLNNS